MLFIIRPVAIEEALKNLLPVIAICPIKAEELVLSCADGRIMNTLLYNESYILHICMRF